MASTRIGGASVTTAEYARFSASLVAGVVASLIGGVVMAVVMVVAFTAFQHQDILWALRPIGAFIFGDRMFAAPTPLMYAAAVAFHFGICTIWGIIFGFAAALLRVDKSTGGALALGIVVGLASQIVDINLVTPPLMYHFWNHDLWTEQVPPLYSWLGHVLFGVSFVVAPSIFRPLWLRWVGRADILADDPRIR